MHVAAGNGYTRAFFGAVWLAAAAGPRWAVAPVSQARLCRWWCCSCCHTSEVRGRDAAACGCCIPAYGSRMQCHKLLQLPTAAQHTLQLLLSQQLRCHPRCSCYAAIQCMRSHGSRSAVVCCSAAAVCAAMCSSAAVHTVPSRVEHWGASAWMCSNPTSCAATLFAFSQLVATFPLHADATRRPCIAGSCICSARDASNGGSRRCICIIASSSCGAA